MINTDKGNSVKKFIGIDIGGMSIKGMIIRGDGTELCRDTIETGCEKGGSAMCDNIVTLINRMIQSIGGYKTDIKGVGIGCPGFIDSKGGYVIFAGNLNLKYFPLQKEVSDRVGLPVRIANDGHAAALGEARFGAGKKFKDSILVTLGTGIGGGIIVDGQLFEGGKSVGTEIGHTVIVADGYPCSCGRKGCFECYASATALMRKTREEMRANKDSLMWENYTPESVSGLTAFEYMDRDQSAKNVVDWYVKHLAIGVVNLANVFRPEAVMFGGGVSGQKERLTAPVQQLVDKEIFAGTDFAPVKIVTASLGSKAGAYGAAALLM